MKVSSRASAPALLSAALIVVLSTTASAVPKNTPCRTCHDGASSGSASTNGCVTCHLDVDAGVGRAITHFGLPLGRDPGSDGPKITCETCHAPHDSDRPFRLKVPDTRVPDPPGTTLDPISELCLQCHEFMNFRNATGEYGIHPVGLSLDAQRRERAMAAGLPLIGLEEGGGVVMSCATCHAVHAADNEDLLRWEYTVNGRPCASCHPHGMTTDITRSASFGPTDARSF